MIEGLTAEDGLDFDAGEGVLKPPGGGLGLGFLNVAAPIEGDDGAGGGVGGKGLRCGPRRGRGRRWWLGRRREGR